MELTDITVSPKAARSLRTADVRGRRQVHITLVYDESDIERAADEARVDLGDADRDSILLLLDDAIGEIVRGAVRSALGERIADVVRVCADAHASGEDD